MIIGACSNPSSQTEQAAKKDPSAFHAIDTTQLAAGTEFYQCPMDPDQVSDQPGACPKCGMPLEKVKKQ
jgi:hypothetical protein